MTKRECFEKMTGCFFFNTISDIEELQNRRSRFEKMMGARLDEDYIGFLWDWGLQLEKESSEERSIGKDIKLAEAIKYLYDARSVYFGSLTIDDKEVLDAMLKALKEVFVQRHTWEGWTIENVDYENMDEYHWRYYEWMDDPQKVGRPTKNKKLQVIGWKLYFILSLEEKRGAISLTKDKLDIITDFVDFFRLYDYPDCKDRKKYELQAVKASMNHFRKKQEFNPLQEYCNAIKKAYLCEANA